MLNCSCPDAKYVVTGTQSIIGVLESNSRGVYIKQSVRYKRIQHQNVEKKKEKRNTWCSLKLTRDAANYI